MAMPTAIIFLFMTDRAEKKNRHYNMATPTAIIFLFMTDRAGKKQTLQYDNANCNHISVYDRQSWEETDTTIWQRQLQSYFCL